MNNTQKAQISKSTSVLIQYNNLDYRNYLCEHLNGGHVQW